MSEYTHGNSPAGEAELAISVERIKKNVQSNVVSCHVM